MKDNPKQPGNGAAEKKSFKFSVDSRPFETEAATITGAAIKEIAGVSASFGLFLESRGSAADQQISDGHVVDLTEPGREQFYTVAPATFGGAW